MKYVSELTGKTYNTASECIDAENDYKAMKAKEKAEKEKKANERKERAEEVKAAREAYIDARSKYAELLEAFTKDYHAWHETYTGEDAKRMAPTLFDSIFDGLFNL
jgi:hypothetical protein